MNLARVEFLVRESDTPSVQRFEFIGISPTELPTGILKAAGYDIQPALVEFASAVVHGNGVTTYQVAMSPKNVEAPDTVSYFVDYLNGQEIGYVRVEHTEAMSYARNTHTEEGFGKKGLGAQRLVMAYQDSTDRFQRTLFSGRATLKEGRRLWKSLIREGLVEPTGNLIDHMYRFKEGVASTSGQTV
jgi:hypothetical protein